MDLSVANKLCILKTGNETKNAGLIAVLHMI